MPTWRQADGPVREHAADAVAGLTDRLGDLPHVIAVQEPRLSADGATALIELRYDVPVTDLDIFGDLAPLEDAAAPTVDAGLQVTERHSARGNRVFQSAGILKAHVTDGDGGFHACPLAFRSAPDQCCA